MAKQVPLYDEALLLSQLNGGNKEAYTYLFKLHYRDLVLFAGSYLNNLDICEDIVQAVFMQLWEEHETLKVDTCLKAYLLNVVKNRCIDYTRHLHVEDRYQLHLLASTDIEDFDTENYILYSNLQDHLADALSRLPVLYREAFVLNRMDGLKYTEIAKHLQVSERTVEVRIGKALGLLRLYLKDFLLLSVLWLVKHLFI